MPTVNYLWNPINDNIVREFDDDGNTIAEYTTEPDLYGNVVSQYRNGQTSYLLSDGQGNTTELTNDAGNVTDTIRYSAFGEVTQRTGTTEIPFQYLGQKGYYRDNVTGDYLARFRPYSARLGRWLTWDQLPVALPFEAYLFVYNNPLCFFDRSGLQAADPNEEWWEQLKSGPKVGDKPCPPCGYVKGSLKVTPVGGKDGYVTSKDGKKVCWGRKVKFTFDVEPGAKKEECALVQWLNGYFGHRDMGKKIWYHIGAIYPRYDIAIDSTTSGNWAIDSRDKDARWPETKYEGGDAFDDPQVCGEVGNSKVADIKFQMCIYDNPPGRDWNVQDPRRIAPSPLTPSSDFAITAVSVVPFEAIECVSWDVKFWVNEKGDFNIGKLPPDLPKK